MIDDVIIELDGNQHFKEVTIFKNDVIDARRIDLEKMKNAKQNSYIVIRIYQPDVYYDVMDWKIMLKDAIDKKRSCYISSNDIYSDWPRYEDL